VTGGLSFTALAAGEAHTSALAEGGRAWCWGSSSVGQLGDGSDALLSPVPTRVAGALSFESLAAGALHTCGVAARVAYCWGSNELGQLGAGTATPPRRAPGSPVSSP
jgi:alpha-tubulin suppressor-like RCC1 family protein